MTLKLFASQLLISLQGGNRYINWGRDIFIVLVILMISRIYF